MLKIYLAILSFGHDNLSRRLWYLFIISIGCKNSLKESKNSAKVELELFVSIEEIRVEAKHSIPPNALCIIENGPS